MTAGKPRDLTQDWLLLVDFQPVFSAPDSPWFTPGMHDLYTRLTPLADRFAGRVLCTRFVPDEDEIQNGWVDYYDRWPFARSAKPGIWELDPPWHGLPEVSSHKFGKWTEETRSILADAAEIVVAGVTTDCCVMGTVLGAVDDGARIRLLSDGCLASTDEDHRMALTLMGYRAPLLRISTIAEVLAEA